MFGKVLLVIAMLAATTGIAFAQVELNKASQPALDGIKGIGPKMSSAILDERQKGGEFKSWPDFETRVKGVGEKSATKLSEAGLTVNGQARPKAAAAAGKEEKRTRLVAKKDDAIK